MYTLQGWLFIAEGIVLLTKSKGYNTYLKRGIITGLSDFCS